MIGTTRTVTIAGLRTESEANLREHWGAKHARKNSQQARVRAALVMEFGCGTKHIAPIALTLARVAPRFLDADNLAGSFKHTIDSVAEFFGVDDRVWRESLKFGQVKGKPREYAVEMILTFAPQESA